MPLPTLSPDFNSDNLDWILDGVRIHVTTTTPPPAMKGSSGSLHKPTRAQTKRGRHFTSCAILTIFYEQRCFAMDFSNDPYCECRSLMVITSLVTGLAYFYTYQKVREGGTQDGFVSLSESTEIEYTTMPTRSTIPMLFKSHTFYNESSSPQ